ncbi:hypothetical protein ACHAW6_006318 [Cyclotella cf. meneghiniana]
MFGLDFVFGLLPLLIAVDSFRFRYSADINNPGWKIRLLSGVSHQHAISNQVNRDQHIIVSETIPRQILSIRGGYIQVITSLSEVESIIEDASKGGQIVVLDFTANNCPPCEMIAPIYKEMSELEEFNKVIFLKVNVSDHPDIAQRYGVDGWPTFLLFKNGVKVDGIIGGQAAKAGLYSLVGKYVS